MVDRGSAGEPWSREGVNGALQDVMSGNSAAVLQNNDTYFYLTWSSSMALSIVQNIEIFNGALPCPQHCPSPDSICTADVISVKELRSWEGYRHVLLCTWLGGLTAGKVVAG